MCTIIHTTSTSQTHSEASSLSFGFEVRNEGSGNDEIQTKCGNKELGLEECDVVEN